MPLPLSDANEWQALKPYLNSKHLALLGTRLVSQAAIDIQWCMNDDVVSHTGSRFHQIPLEELLHLSAKGTSGAAVP